MASGPNKKLTGKELYQQAEAQVGKQIVEISNEVNSMVGAEETKKQLDNIISQEINNVARRLAGKPVDPASTINNYLIAGNPGTGKTKIAKILSKLFAATGSTQKDEVMIKTGSDLIKGYIGQSGEEMLKFLSANKGKTILIDEAHEMANNAEYGMEAIGALVGFTEENPDTAVILAGYGPKAGQQIMGNDGKPRGSLADLMKLNPGLKSRFPGTITMGNYDEATRAEILQQHASSGDVPAKLRLTPDQLVEVVTNENVDWSQENARGVVNALKQARERAAVRGKRTHDVEAIENLLPEDFGLKPSKV